MVGGCRSWREVLERGPKQQIEEQGDDLRPVSIPLHQTRTSRGRNPIRGPGPFRGPGPYIACRTDQGHNGLIDRPV